MRRNRDNDRLGRVPRVKLRVVATAAAAATAAAFRRPRFEPSAVNHELILWLLDDHEWVSGTRSSTATSGN